MTDDNMWIMYAPSKILSLALNGCDWDYLVFGSKKLEPGEFPSHFCRDILYSKFYRFSCTTDDVMTFLIFVLRKHYSYISKKDISKEEMLFFLYFEPSVFWAFQIGSNYFSVHRHLFCLRWQTGHAKVSCTHCCLFHPILVSYKSHLCCWQWCRGH